MIHYLVATYPDRISAETAYTYLERAEISPENLTLLGTGYKTWAEVDILDPFAQARQDMQRMLLWLVPFGFFAGFAFNQATQLTIVPGLSSIDNSVIGGAFGAIAGGLGSLTVGGGLKVIIAGRSGTPYQERLLQGKYILIFTTGNETQIRKVERLLPKGAEAIQTYTDLS
ncbi:hypothetical protein L3556_09610 [Candidatus Synechococcus calcipolaris G9]|uniref:DUF1269 domain-containing protein n=1 Tax=Candidatus Synechococcus calcipolaris G9 TaxID=1497997 RepID=A0ABT6F019_9SYNE|nr:hypothetical protein [Candidatus Synechococcus calcipolaris]MDG2991182.1 hypothetical protein [Candidatus Synechococcus calcipolaris G9]